MDDFGVRVRAARVAAGLTQLELARAMGYSTRSTISRIESGDNQVPMDRLDALAAALPAVHDLLIRLLNFHEFLFGLRGVRLAHVRIGVIPLAERSIGLLHLVVAGRRGYA